MRSSQRPPESSERFVRIETAAADVDRSVYTVRTPVRAGRVPAIRKGNLLLVDLDALREIYAPTPVR